MKTITIANVTFTVTPDLLAVVKDYQVWDSAKSINKDYDHRCYEIDGILATLFNVINESIDESTFDYNLHEDHFDWFRDHVLDMSWIDQINA